MTGCTCGISTGGAGRRRTGRETLTGCARWSSGGGSGRAGGGRRGRGRIRSGRLRGTARGSALTTGERDEGCLHAGGRGGGGAVRGDAGRAGAGPVNAVGRGGWTPSTRPANVISNHPGHRLARPRVISQ